MENSAMLQHNFPYYLLPFKIDQNHSKETILSGLSGYIGKTSTCTQVL